MATIANAGTEPSWYPIDLTAGSNGLGLASTLWCATFRHQFTGNANPGQSREKNQVYWKGIKEKITVRTDTNAPVRWRRIVFEAPVLPDMTAVPTGSYVAYTAMPDKGAIADDNDQGATYAYYRAFKSQGEPQRAAIEDLIFRGRRGVDWTDHMAASVDTAQARVLYDKVIRFGSSADSGVIRNFNMWHPLEKNMSYIGDEFGATMAQSNGFANAQRGTLGNVFIWDLFDWTPQGVGTMLVNSDACCYWHER